LTATIARPQATHTKTAAALYKIARMPQTTMTCAMHSNNVRDHEIAR